MADRLSRLWLLPAAGAFALAVWCCRPTVGAQEKKPTANPGGKGPVLYYGASACGQAGGCHDAPEPRYDLKTPLLCRCNEMTVWLANDKHADAYKVLLGERGQRMLDSLYKDKDPGKADACLACHAVTAKETHAGSFRLDEGVGCVVCHGPYAKWVRHHISPLDRDEFRALTAKQKEEDYGMTDLANPVRRSKLCASCHVGSAEEKKVVTHEMYAAGHPPLPGLEVASFSYMMPPHWEPRADKAARAAKLVRHDGTTREQAKLVLVGAAVSLAEYMRLVAVQAEKEKALDWASFDCWSCHHELKSPAWRQTRGYPGKPGRVPAKTWPAELVRLALGHLGDDPAEFENLWGEVQAAFVARQFGDVPRVAKAAGALAAWADKLTGRLNDSTVDEAAAAKLLAKLPSLAKTPDFDSARQLGWAYRAVWDELSPKKEPPSSLKELTTELGLLFPPGRMQASDREGVIVRDLGKSLKRLNDYDPAKFLRLWRGLAAPGK